MIQIINKNSEVLTEIPIHKVDSLRHLTSLVIERLSIPVADTVSFGLTIRIYTGALPRVHSQLINDDAHLKRLFQLTKYRLETSAPEPPLELTLITGEPDWLS